MSNSRNQEVFDWIGLPGSNVKHDLCSLIDGYCDMNLTFTFITFHFQTWLWRGQLWNRHRRVCAPTKCLSEWWSVQELQQHVHIQVLLWFCEILYRWVWLSGWWVRVQGRWVWLSHWWVWLSGWWVRVQGRWVWLSHWWVWLRYVGVATIKQGEAMT